MSNITKVKESIEVGKSLKVLTQAFTDLASMKLRRIRSDIERNRKFIEEISRVYGVVRQEAIKRNVIFTKTPKDKVSILITSNLGFYGAINSNTSQTFVVGTAKYKTDRIVIGLQGKKFLEDIKYFHKFESIIFKDDLPSPDELVKIIEKISIYKQIIVYYSELKSVLVQVPAVKDITQSSKMVQQQTQVKTTELSYLFEPEVDKMVRFFEGQILGTLFEQTFLESELARTASRLMSMNTSQLNADKFIKERKRELFKTIMLTQNSRIIDTVNNLVSLQKK